MESSSPLLSAIKYKREMLTLISPQRWEVRKQSPCSIPQEPRECLGVAGRLCPERQLCPPDRLPVFLRVLGFPQLLSLWLGHLPCETNNSG